MVPWGIIYYKFPTYPHLVYHNHRAYSLREIYNIIIYGFLGDFIKINFPQKVKFGFLINQKAAFYQKMMLNVVQPLLIFTLLNGLHKSFSQKLQPMHVHETLNAIPTYNRTLTIGLTIARDSVILFKLLKYIYIYIYIYIYLLFIKN